jgi:hypothetical protein
LAFEERYKDIGCQICKVLSRTISGRGAATKTPEKFKSVGFVSGARLCHEYKMSATTSNFFFAKKNGPRKPEMFYITFDCYHLNPARTRTLSVLPGPALGPGRAEDRARADLYRKASTYTRHCNKEGRQHTSVPAVGFEATITVFNRSRHTLL